MRIGVYAFVLVCLLASACDGPSGSDAGPQGTDAGPRDAAPGADAGADAGDACDEDGDGHRSRACGGTDCDDGDANRYLGNAEVCDPDGRDEDCDPTTFGVRDGDGDGYPDARCCNTDDADGTVRCGTDCDDANALVHPTEAEACDGFDNDCNGLVDDGLGRTYYADADGDGRGDPATAVEGCEAPAGFVANDNDCDDACAECYTGAVDACDGFDNDCDGVTDPGAPTWYVDCDGDDYAASAAGAVTACSEPARDLTGCDNPSTRRWTTRTPDADNTDCDDGRPLVHPGATELCNDVDDDCDGLLDGPGEDGDGDGHAPTSCGGGDCDDARADVRPGAPERCDGRDNDCDGDFEDEDGDGHGRVGFSCTGGTLPMDDCDDANHLRHPGAPFRSEGYCPPLYSWDATLRACRSPLLSPPTRPPLWDWNCDGVTERQPAFDSACASTACTGMLCCLASTDEEQATCGTGAVNSGPVYSGTPDCGTVLPYRVCHGCRHACGAVTLSDRPLLCR